MYFPYLRGKQFELIALREFATQHPNAEKIVPIIEPVKSTFNGLTTATKVMFERQLHFALVLNPTDGDFKRVKKIFYLNYLFLDRIQINGFRHFYIITTKMKYYQPSKFRN